MADISKINAVALANIAKLDEVTAANIAKVNGLVFAAGAAVPAPAAAYSVRLLGSAVGVPTYTGACMRIRRDTAGGTGDDDEADVAFDTSLSTPTISLDSAISNASSGVTATTFGQFVAASGYSNPDSLSGTILAYVDQWHDQSGNGNDAEQTTHGSQPQIYNGSAVITENGKPALQSDGINDHLIFSDVTSTDFCFINVQTWHATDMGYGGASGTFAAYGLSTNLTRWRLSGVTSNFSFSASNGLQYLAVANRASNSLQVHFNGSSGGTYTNSGSAVLNTLMAGNATSFNLNGRTQEFIIYSSDQSTNRSGIETDINDYFQIGNFPNPTSGLLSTYTGAAAAYSVRQLANTAALCMRVRRDNDDAEQDFGFDANGDLDTAAIATFVGSGNNGYVSKWYDQSGNGNDAAQTTNGSQPQIYNGSAVITENGKPAVDFDGSDVLINHTGNFTTGTAKNEFYVVTFDSVANSGVMNTDDAPRVAQNMKIFGAKMVTLLFSPSLRPISSVTGSTTLTTATQYLMGDEYVGTTLSLYLNGSSEGSTTHTTPATGGSNVSIGTDYRSNNGFISGRIQEIISFQTNKSSNRTSIETDINNYFSIY